MVDNAAGNWRREKRRKNRVCEGKQAISFRSINRESLLISQQEDGEEKERARGRTGRRRQGKREGHTFRGIKRELSSDLIRLNIGEDRVRLHLLVVVAYPVYHGIAILPVFLDTCTTTSEHFQMMLNNDE